MHTAIAAVLLTARFYTLVDVAAADRAAATIVAANILHSAGIEVLWRDCNDRRSPSQSGTLSSCMTPLNSDEVIVRFVTAPAPGPNHSHADSLGDAYVDTLTGTGSLATVYVDRVAWMARLAGVDAATLLGRVTAHELGHLLLGTARHRATGLMRAAWSTAAVQRQIASDWRLSKLDAANARTALLKRANVHQSPDAPMLVPCATAPAEAAPLVCPACPVCMTRLPADRMALHLIVEPGF